LIWTAMVQRKLRLIRVQSRLWTRIKF